MRTGSARQPQLVYVPVGDLQLAVWDWPGAEPGLLFAHATSFHGRCWDAIVREFPGRRCLVLDARGHGRSSKPAPPYHWSGFRDDLLEIIARFGISQAIGIGHSLGGHALTAAAAVRPGAFRALVLADPTIRPPGAYHAPPVDVSFARKRRARWSSPDEMFESFRRRPPFASWKPGILRDYCDFGLLPEGPGFVLACSPETEASVYECSREPAAEIHSVLASVKIPVFVLRAGYRGDLRFSWSPTDPLLASRFPDGHDMVLEANTHLIPMEAPEAVVEQIRKAGGPEMRDSAGRS